MSYQILAQDARRATLQCVWMCPYCLRKATASAAAYPPDYPRLESGGFCGALRCSECGQTAQVRFWNTMRMD